jgi:hypothetical protein
LQGSDETEKNCWRIAAVGWRVGDDSEKSTGSSRLSEELFTIFVDPSLPLVSTYFPVAISIGNAFQLRR